MVHNAHFAIINYSKKIWLRLFILQIYFTNCLYRLYDLSITSGWWMMRFNLRNYKAARIYHAMLNRYRCSHRLYEIWWSFIIQTQHGCLVISVVIKGKYYQNWSTRWYMLDFMAILMNLFRNTVDWILWRQSLRENKVFNLLYKAGIRSHISSIRGT